MGSCVHTAAKSGEIGPAANTDEMGPAAKADEMGPVGKAVVTAVVTAI
jgi:hypothetical protein